MYHQPSINSHRSHTMKVDRGAAYAHLSRCAKRTTPLPNAAPLSRVELKMRQRTLRRDTGKQPKNQQLNLTFLEKEREQNQPPYESEIDRGERVLQ